MTTSEVITHVLQLIAGVGTFMVACDILSDNLQALSSSKLKSLFSKISNNKIIGVCIGAITTMLIQSSGATTVMVLGFVNAEIISLKQAVTIVLGSEIGTTLTGQIVALGMFNESSISLNTIFAAFIGIGAFVDLLAKKDKIKKIGGICIGFGMIFVGLSMMSSSMNEFATLPELKDFLAHINSTILLIVAGGVLTALIHSSSAMTTIAITMIAANLISLKQGIYITLGANVGTCITGVLAAAGSGVSAKRTSLYQLLFNGGGVVILVVLDTLISIATLGKVSISVLFEDLFPHNPSTQLAMFHTFFNIASVIVALPISDMMANLSIKLIHGEEEVNKKRRLRYFDENMMSTPTIAVAQVKNEIINMANIAINNFNISLNIIKTLDFARQEEFENNEEELNYLNQYLVDVVSRLSKRTSNAKDHSYLSTTYRAISDFERIGDYSENIIEYAQHLSTNNLHFSSSALEEINNVQKLINDLFDLTIKVYKHYDEYEFSQAMTIEEHVDELTEMMATNHIIRMNSGDCNADIGAQYLQLSSDVERIADHLININDKNFIISH